MIEDFYNARHLTIAIFLNYWENPDCLTHTRYKSFFSVENVVGQTTDNSAIAFFVS